MRIIDKGTSFQVLPQNNDVPVNMLLGYSQKKNDPWLRVEDNFVNRIVLNIPIDLKLNQFNVSPQFLKEKGLQPFQVEDVINIRTTKPDLKISVDKISKGYVHFTFKMKEQYALEGGSIVLYANDKYVDKVNIKKIEALSEKGFSSKIKIKEGNILELKLEDLVTGKRRKIGQKTAIQILGRETFLSGLSRAAFHWSSSRYSADQLLEVSFYCGKLFR